MRARLLGHHIHRPRSRLSAVTRTDRTTIVSSRMPNATAKPISVRNVDGIVARTATVPASTKSAEVITPAGGGKPGQRAALGVAAGVITARRVGHQRLGRYGKTGKGVVTVTMVGR